MFFKVSVLFPAVFLTFICAENTALVLPSAESSFYRPDEISYLKKKSLNISASISAGFANTQSIIYAFPAFSNFAAALTILTSFTPWTELADALSQPENQTSSIVRIGASAARHSENNRLSFGISFSAGPAFSSARKTSVFSASSFSYHLKKDILTLSAISEDKNLSASFAWARYLSINSNFSPSLLMAVYQNSFSTGAGASYLFHKNSRPSAKISISTAVVFPSVQNNMNVSAVIFLKNKRLSFSSSIANTLVHRQALSLETYF